MEHVRAYESRDAATHDRDPHVNPIRSERSAGSTAVSTSTRYALLDLALAAGAIPDAVLRAGSRVGARARLRHEQRGGVEAQDERMRALVSRMSSGPIAELPAKANEQH